MSADPAIREVVVNTLRDRVRAAADITKLFLWNAAMKHGVPQEFLRYGSNALASWTSEEQQPAAPVPESPKPPEPAKPTEIVVKHTYDPVPPAGSNGSKVSASPPLPVQPVAPILSSTTPQPVAPSESWWCSSLGKTLMFLLPLLGVGVGVAGARYFGDPAVVEKKAETPSTAVNDVPIKDRPVEDPYVWLQSEGEHLPERK